MCLEVLVSVFIKQIALTKVIYIPSFVVFILLLEHFVDFDHASKLYHYVA